MNIGRTIFSQVTDLIHREQFNRCMALHPMPRVSRAMTVPCNGFRSNHLQGNIEACLRGCSHSYDMGIRGNLTRTNLAYANEHRNRRVYQALAQILIRKARKLYAEDSKALDIDEMVYALDASSSKRLKSTLIAS